MTHEPEPVEVSAVILFDGARMLVTRRPPGTYYEGWWEWPGGKRRPGESAEQCARRELIEETGYQAAALAEYRTITADYPGRRVRVTFFVGRVAHGAAPSAEAHEHLWLLPEEAFGLQFLKPNLPVLQALVERPPHLA